MNATPIEIFPQKTTISNIVLLTNIILWRDEAVETIRETLFVLDLKNTERALKSHDMWGEFDVFLQNVLVVIEPLQELGI